MTERWSGVFLEPQRQRCWSEEDLEGERRWFTAGARRAVSEDGVLLRVLVTRTSVVEMSSKHLGGALKECRKASEVSGAERQQAPDKGHGQATEKAADPDGAGGHSPSAKVLRWDSKLGRESVQARTWARKGRKIRAAPRW